MSSELQSLAPGLPLFDQNAHPDGWHDVRAPGGYEWWYFDAEDAATDTQVVVIFMAGFIFHPGYLRAYDRYIKRPTKHLPPTAGDFPCAYACVYRGGKVWKQFFTQYRADDFSAEKNRAGVRIGSLNESTDSGGAYAVRAAGTPWAITPRGPQRADQEQLSVSLTFTPARVHEPIQRTFLSRPMTGADHLWTIAAPHCRVRGQIELRHPDGSTPIEALAIEGQGYHDHNYGTAPIRQGLHRWMWGRAVFGDRVLTFHHAEPNDRTRSAETHLLELTDAGAARDIAIDRVTGDWSLACKPAMMLKYPATMSFDDRLKLSNPRVLDPSPFYMRLSYDAESRGEQARAFCEIAYPNRLSWPLLGRMIEMSFDKRPSRR